MTPIKPLLWAELTWEQIAAMRTENIDMVIFPIGSTEQHGPHLPLNVDTLSAEVIAHAVSSQTGVPVLPTMPFGCALGHTHFWPGTLSLSPQTLAAVVREVLEDVIAYGFHRVLVLSGHMMNAAPLRCALEELRHKHPHLQIAQKHVCEASIRVQELYSSDAQDWHANAAETALMMHIAPDLVHHDRIFDDPDRTRNLVFSYAVPQTSQSGHTGEPSKATPEMGAELFAAVVRDWTYVVKKALNEQAPLRPVSPPDALNSFRKQTPDTPLEAAIVTDATPPPQPPICGPPQRIELPTVASDLFRTPTL